MQHTLYPPSRLGDHPWRIVETGFNAVDYSLNATLFALGNGYIGLRGTFDEGLLGAESDAGCYLNGVYYAEPIRYGEKAYGYARHNQRIAAAALPHELTLALDGQRVDLRCGEILEHRRELRMDEGLLYRRLRWRAPNGPVLVLESRRLVSLTERHLIATEYHFSLESGIADIELASSLNAVPGVMTDSDDPRVGAGIHKEDLVSRYSHASEETLALSHHLLSSGFTLSSAAAHHFDGAPVQFIRHASEPFRATSHYRFALTDQTSVTLTKYALFDHSRGEPVALDNRLKECRRHRFADYARAQTRQMQQFWQTADIEIDGAPRLQQGLRFNLFHLFQSLGRTPDTNIAAKGLTGHGYDGHYFWDSEIYILPFFLYTQPQLARNLLLYRHRILDSARARARELAIPKGALYPWRTIGGEECSAYYPAGTAQFHINADIAYAVRQYHEATGDDEFLRDIGAEIVFETARLWPAIGHFNPHRDGQFCINEVTGPDEYTALVNNNFFTNAMAQRHLHYAATVFDWLQNHFPEQARTLYRKLSLKPAEVAQWQHAADAMFLPFDATQGIHLQDDSFLDKPRWDFEHTPAEHYPLLLHYHPLTIYRHQVCKQADTVLALFLLGEQFSTEQKRRDFDFYEPLTTHDSTLSACAHSIIANEIGYTDKASAYFEQVARMDLDNHHRNTQHGIHTACMGGTWLCMVQGFAGMRQRHPQGLSFRPRLPSGLSGYRFQIQVRGQQLSVRVDERQVQYRLVSGDNLRLRHEGDSVSLTSDQPEASFPLATIAAPSTHGAAR